MSNSQKDELNKQLNTFWGRIESLLIGKSMRGDVLREFGDKLRAANNEERAELIMNNYGELYLDRISPLLYQVNAIESELKKLETVAVKTST